MDAIMYFKISVFKSYFSIEYTDFPLIFTPIILVPLIEALIVLFLVYKSLKEHLDERLTV